MSMRALARQGVARSLLVLVAVSTLFVVTAPPSPAGVARVQGLAQTPHTNVAAIYNEFGGVSTDVGTLAGIAGDLADEGYQVHSYADPNEGNGSRGTATLANFVGMAKQASVIVIDGHGYDPAALTQECIAGKGLSIYDAGAPASPSSPTVPGPTGEVQQCAAPNGPILQVEWYPTLAAGQQARRDYVTQGYKDEWFFGPLYVATNLRPRTGDKVELTAQGAVDVGRGFRPALFLTASGIAHFFAKQRLDIVDVESCQSMGLAASFNARTYFGHAKSACAGPEELDDRKLFDRMTGHSGVEARPTTAAFEMGGFVDQYFQISSASKPVVLSPAVAEVTPGDGGGVSGVTTPVSVQFDAKMSKAAATSVVTASGCEATIANAKWGGDAELSFDLKVPKIQEGKTVTLTVHQNAAKSAGQYPHALDGNQDPSDSGVAPNRDDYVWQLSCAPASTFKMVYTGTYEFHYLQTIPGFAPTTETGSYTWTQTQIIKVSAGSATTTEYDSTTTLDASGSSTLDGPGLSLSCAIQTPQDYRWVAKRLGGRVADNGSSPISFSWSIESPPPPGTAGATGNAGNGPPSGCQSNQFGFRPELGIPEPTPNGERTALDATQMQTFQDAESGSVSVPGNQLPKTMHFDIDAQRSTTEGTATNTASMTFHATMTLSKVS